MDDATQRALRDFAARCRRLPPLADRKAGLHALFSGPAGSGKHQALRTLADKLGLDVQQVKLGAIQKKYEAGTERRLAKMLAQAEHKAVVLLFLGGGPSHIETFNPSMDAPSPFRRLTGEVQILV